MSDRETEISVALAGGPEAVIAFALDLLGTAGMDANIVYANKAAILGREALEQLRRERDEARELLEQAEVDMERKVDAELRGRLVAAEAQVAELREALRLHHWKSDPFGCAVCARLASSTGEERQPERGGE